MITVNKIYEKLEELIRCYDNYLLRNEDATLDILIEEDSISFYLLGPDIEDNLIIKFNEKDKDTLTLLGIKIIIKIFGNVLMHLDGITLYNNVHKKNIKINILNSKIYELVEYMISIEEDVFINFDLPLVKDLDKKSRKLYKSSFLKSLNDRVELSKKMLKK